MRKMAINRKVLVLMAGTFLLIFSVSVALFIALFYNREQAAVKEEVRGTYHRLESRVDGYMKEVDLASVTVMCSRWVQGLFTRNKQITPSQDYMDRTNAQGFLSSFASMYGELDCCIAIAPGDFVKNNLSYQIAPRYDPSTLPWWETFLEEEKYRIFGHNEMFTKKIQDRSVTTYYLIKSIYSLKPIGYFVTNINYDTFKFLEEMLGENERVMITDRSGNLVYSNMSPQEQAEVSCVGEQAAGAAEKQATGAAGEQAAEATEKQAIGAAREHAAGTAEKQATEIAGESAAAAAEYVTGSGTEPGTMEALGGDILYYNKLQDDNWNVWLLKRRMTLVQSLSKNSYVFFLLIPALLVFALVSFMVSRYLTKPIVLCTQALSEVRNENYEVRIPNPYQDEIGDMIAGFNDMAANLGHLRELNRTMYKARLETEFRILQQRINPHFLCNTLEMVSGMILSEEDDNALELIGMLGRMYRYDLGENDIATFDEEMTYLNNYLSILAYKYPDLKVYYEIDPGVGSYRIPKFICQPLVENTLKHGFSGRISGACLWIRIWRLGHEQSLTENGLTQCDPAENRQTSLNLTELTAGTDRQEPEIGDHGICISIRDNGKGIEPGLLEDLRRKISELRDDQTMEISEHIGLLNTARRLFLFFGKECRLQIQSGTDEGTHVMITIPAREKSNDGHPAG